MSSSWAIHYAIFVVVLCFYFSGTQQDGKPWNSDAEELNNTIYVDAVIGKTAFLPCNLEPDGIDDRVYMVLWFMKSSGRPLYRRERPEKDFYDIYFEDVTNKYITPNMTTIEIQDLYEIRDKCKAIRKAMDSDPDTPIYLAAYLANFAGDVRVFRKLMKEYFPDYQDRFKSFDVRGRSFEKALHWSDPSALGDRALFIRDPRFSLTALALKNVEFDDEGLYRCRVDFKNSPTRNMQIELRVIVPPHQMLLSDDNGRDLAGVVGPLKEGDNFSVTCEMRGGMIVCKSKTGLTSRPQPVLSWFLEDVLIPQSNVELIKHDDNVIVSRVTLVNAKKEWTNKTLKCKSTNSKLLSGYERSARIEMLLRPFSVNITDKPRGGIISGIPLNMTCVSRGSRPPAEIIWYWNNRRQQCIKFEGNESVSVGLLTIVPDAEDADTSVICRAENSRLNVALEDSVKLNVFYKPIVYLGLGSTFISFEVREGDDVYFECIIKANPKEHRIKWYHNDEDIFLKSDGTINRKLSTHGVYTSSRNLILQKVTKEDGGLYSCKVTNQIGETCSQPLHLKVNFAPICAMAVVVPIGAIMDQDVRVRCAVTASPADVTFTWRFNNTNGESIKINHARYGKFVATGGMASELRYTVASERDLGIIECRATNSIGESQKPCFFKVVPATRPKPPKNCRPMRVPVIQDPYVAIHCMANSDGGLQQHFVLEIPQRKEHGVLVNLTLEAPGYYANYLPPLWFWLNVTWDLFVNIQEHEDLVATARNILGSSDPVIIPRKHLLYRKLEVIETTTEAPPKQTSKLPIAVATGAVLLLLAVAAALVVYFYKRREGRAATVATSKRPSQNVVQVDNEGRSYLIAYPPGHDKETKPDVTPKPDQDPPRVVLGSTGGQDFTVRVTGIPTLDAAVASVWNNRCNDERPARNDDEPPARDDVQRPAPNDAPAVDTSIRLRGPRGVKV